MEKHGKSFIKQWIFIINLKKELFQSTGDNPEATDKQYDIMQLNVTLFKYTNEILGV